MSKPIQICLYNTQPEFSEELCDQLSALKFARFIGEVSDPENLSALLQKADVNLIFFHLDPSPPTVIEVIEEVSSHHPSVAMIAVSHQTAPEAILAPIRAGCDQFVCEPIDHDDLATAMNRVSRKRLGHRTRSQCICVTAASGGMGTTSTACNLALELGNLRESQCALVDLNLQFGDVAINFDIEPKYTTYDLAESTEQLDRRLLIDAMTVLPCNVALLPRPELTEQHDAVTPEVIHRIIEMVNLSYESVVIDLPRDLDAVTMAALQQADVILVVCQLLIPSIRNTKRYYDALLRADIPEERIQFVINRITKNAGRISQKDVEDAVGKPVYACIPNDFEFMARSLDLGRPIAALGSNNVVRRAIRDIAERLVGAPAGEDEAKSQKRGLFGRFLSRSSSR